MRMAVVERVRLDCGSTHLPLNTSFLFVIFFSSSCFLQWFQGHNYYGANLLRKRCTGDIKFIKFYFYSSLLTLLTLLIFLIFTYHSEIMIYFV